METHNGTYLDMLRTSAEETGSIVCMGLDPIPESIPVRTGSIRADLNHFYQAIFRAMKKRSAFPGAFKPNIGYYQSLDRPREEDFSGSLALADLLEMLENFFPGIPVILDSKRGDIARSSANYAAEAFTAWGADAVTVSPYMGDDSVNPFFKEGKGLYILDRTSNPGAADLQSQTLSGSSGDPLYMAVARLIVKWSQRHPGTGAVVGATSLEELGMVARYFADHQIPLLIPGVGSQGGSGGDTVRCLMAASYDLSLVRINSSSGITHPWGRGPIPEDWVDVVVGRLEDLQVQVSDGTTGFGIGSKLRS